MARNDPDLTPHKHDWGPFVKKKEWKEGDIKYFRYERTCKDKTCKATDIHSRVTAKPRG